MSQVSGYSAFANHDGMGVCRITGRNVADGNLVRVVGHRHGGVDSKAGGEQGKSGGEEYSFHWVSLSKPRIRDPAQAHNDALVPFRAT